jgi:peptide/nickel transport system substrate-binding protein
MDVVDSQTLKITLKSANALFPATVAKMSNIGSPTAIDRLGTQFASNPVGAGPFVVKSWVRDAQMILDRNPTYWNAPLPYLDEVVIKNIADESQRVNSMCAGEAQVVLILTVGAAVQNQSSKCGVNNAGLQSGGQALVFNTKKAPFNDIRARQAVAMAWDPAAFSATLDQGLIPPAKSAFRSDSPYYDPTILQPAYDKAKAQALFNAVAADTGGPVKFTWSTYNIEPFKSTAEYMQGILNSYNNVHVDLQENASTAQVAIVNSGAFQAETTQLVWDEADPTFTSPFSCSANPDWTGWCLSSDTATRQQALAFDAAASTYRSSLDAAKRVDAMKTMQKAVYAAVPVDFLEPKVGWILTKSNMNGFAYVNDFVPDLRAAWLKR